MQVEHVSQGSAPTALEVTVDWTGDFRFAGRGASTVSIDVDGDGKTSPSPMEALLAALGSCAGYDIVDILRKGRRTPRALSLRLVGERRQEVPRRFTRIAVLVRIGGPVEVERAERAVRLAFDKYCSVRATLDPAMPIEVATVVEP
jgi:putative redox protein